MAIDPTTKNSKLIIAGIVAVVVIAFVAFSLHRAAQIEKAAEQCEAAAKLFDEDENFHQNAVLDPDPWNTPLKIEVESNDLSATCKVTSAGPDKQFGTGDDISKSNINFRPDAEAIGERVGTTSVKFGTGLAKGMVKAVKEKIKKKD